jgi:hypothetical protein
LGSKEQTHNPFKRHYSIKLWRGKMAYKLSRLLEILGDGKWHDTDQLTTLMELSNWELFEITDFLGKYNFAQIDDNKKRVRIAKDFKKILTLAT